MHKTQFPQNPCPGFEKRLGEAMLNENKNERYICQTMLNPTPINPVVTENMTDTKESESCSDADATVNCDNKVKIYEQTLKMWQAPQLRTKKEQV